MWTLILVFAINGSGFIATSEISGFKSLKDCGAQGKLLLDTDEKTNQVVIAKWVCVEVKK